MRLELPSPGEWATMTKAERLVAVLRLNGPITTGVLGHQFGLGENIRGICREARALLARQGSGWTISSGPTFEIDGKGNRIRHPWVTYSLVQTDIAGREARADRMIPGAERALAKVKAENAPGLARSVRSGRDGGEGRRGAKDATGPNVARPRHSGERRGPPASSAAKQRGVKLGGLFSEDES